MKARMKPGSTLTNRQKEDLQEYIHIEVAKHLQTEREGATRRLFKLMAVALNELYGFGMDRTLRLITDINERLEDDDPVFWTHIDQRVKQIGLQFQDEDWREFS